MSILKLELNLCLPERWNPKWRDPDFENVFSRDWKLSKNKSFEVELHHTTWHDLFQVELDLEFSGRDHAGPRFFLTVLGWTLHVMLYDIRHWNWNEKRWCEEGDDYNHEEHLIPLHYPPETI